jgi:septal ring factor EnvC (AmiA/AmiB activator)
MYNDEFRRKITRVEKDTREVAEKRKLAKKELDQTYQQIFTTNETLKLYDKTNDDLEKAINTEKAYLEYVSGQVNELRKLLYEENHHKDQYKGLANMQEKKIHSLGQKHIRNTGQLERHLTVMNEQIQSCIDSGAVTLKQLERNTRNMQAKQASQFFKSKYEQSRMVSGWGYS